MWSRSAPDSRSPPSTEPHPAPQTEERGGPLLEWDRYRACERALDAFMERSQRNLRRTMACQPTDTACMLDALEQQKIYDPVVDAACRP
jgi:hypothetical protein